MPTMNAMEPLRRYVNGGSGNILMLSGNKPLPQPMLTQIPWHHMVSQGPMNFNSLRPGCKLWYFKKIIFSFSSFLKSSAYLFKFYSLMFLNVSLTIKSASAPVMTWFWSGHKPLPGLVYIIHNVVSGPQWVYYKKQLVWIAFWVVIFISYIHTHVLCRVFIVKWHHIHYGANIR